MPIPEGSLLKLQMLSCPLIQTPCKQLEEEILLEEVFYNQEEVFYDLFSLTAECVKSEGSQLSGGTFSSFNLTS